MGPAGGKLPTVAIAVLLALFLVACGGDDDDSSGGETTAAQGQGGDAAGGQSQGDSKGSGGSGDSGGGSGDSASSNGGQQHQDSGGGSAQFKTKGGDNSVQEFGSEADTAEFDQAAEAVHGFFDARVRGDWEAACSYLAADVAESLQQLSGKSKELADGGCPETLEAISEGVPQSAFKEAAKADIGSLRVEGDQAFVIYVGANQMVLAMPMKDEDGTWTVASLAGTPLN
jgi:hypothetical protein